MMKSKKALSVLSFMLAAAMLPACSGSGSSSQPAPSSSSNAPAPSTSQASSAAPLNASSEAPASDVLEELPLPLTNEKVSLRLWKPWNNDYTPDLNEYAVVKEMEAKTGVHIEYETVLTSSASEKYGMLLASNDLPDMICHTSNIAYPGGGEKASSGLAPQSEQFSHIFGDNIGLVSWQRFDLLNPAERLAAREVYDADGTSLVLPQIELTDAEGLEYNSLYTDIQTMVQEKTAAYVMGTEPLDTYDNFVASIKAMNIDRCIELKQAALNRYEAR